MSRYSRYKILNNNSRYYRFLRKERNDLQSIQHYETPILYHPDVLDRSTLNTTTHIWALGDRYYTLADQYYGDPQLWWIIAWYNGRPTEADCFPGDLLSIPLEADAVMAMLGIG